MSKRKLDYDAMLNHVGEGKFQRRATILFALVQLPVSIQVLLTVFTMAMPDFRCAVPGLPNDTYNIQDSAHLALVNASIPYDTHLTTYAKCDVYSKIPIIDISNNNINNGNNGNGRSTSFPVVVDDDDITMWTNNSYSNNRTVERCTRWVYSTDVVDTTLVADLNLVCDRKIMITHTNFVAMLGLLIGSFLSGVLADCFGRKLVTVIALVLQVIAGSCIALVDSYTILIATRFLASLLGFVGILAGYTWAIEMVSAHKRTTMGMLIMVGWGSGLVLLSIVSFGVKDWQILQVIVTAPALILVLSFWVLPESPRWLICKGRYSDALKVLEHIARLNNTELPKDALLSEESSDGDLSLENGTKQIQFKAICDENTKQEDQGKEREEGRLEPQNSQSILLVLKSRVLLIRFSIVFLNWIVCAMVYYGLALNVGTLVEGSLHWNFFLASVLEVLCYLIVMVAVKKLGRKTIYCPCLIIGGLGCLGNIVPILMESNQAWISTVLCNIGKMGVTACFAIIFIITTELLPTVVRNSGLGFSSFMGRIGAIISPYIGNLHYVVKGPMGKALPLVIFGSLAILAGLLALLLPETSNKPLPETLEEAEAIRSDKKEKPRVSPPKV